MYKKVYTMTRLGAKYTFQRVSQQTRLSVISMDAIVTYGDWKGIASRDSFQIMGDVLVLAATWTKKTQVYQEARRLNIRAPFATTLFRDGTTYFLYVFPIRRQSRIMLVTTQASFWI
ncbi:hypothetical protein BC629DRAFT_1474209 [Irpex lacteus]|nr:hypothetical protein BC629DRAFT_1474209 [Irpex lacteus]